MNTADIGPMRRTGKVTSIYRGPTKTIPRGHITRLPDTKLVIKSVGYARDVPPNFGHAQMKQLELLVEELELLVGKARHATDKSLADRMKAAGQKLLKAAARLKTLKT